MVVVLAIQSGEGDKTFQFEAMKDNLDLPRSMNLADGKSYKINNVMVLIQTVFTQRC